MCTYHEACVMHIFLHNSKQTIPIKMLIFTGEKVWKRPDKPPTATAYLLSHRIKHRREPKKKLHTIYRKRKEP